MKRPSDMTLGAILLVLGAFAGFCLGRFTSNLAPKELVMQWDIGNTFVGAATTIVALTSIWIALSKNKIEGLHKIAEFRIQWVRDVRICTAKLFGLIEAIRRSTLYIVQDKNNIKPLNLLVQEFSENKSQLFILLNHKEALHRKALDELDNISNHFVILAQECLKTPINKDIIKIETDNILNDAGNVNVIIREIIESQWDRIETEVKEGT